MTLKALAVFLSLTLAAASQALPLIRERATSPGCYEHANTALLGALRAVENKARVKCGGAYPVLQGVQVEVKRVGGCTPVTVTGSYLCASAAAAERAPDLQKSRVRRPNESRRHTT
jgi:hypothetical protein